MDLESNFILYIFWQVFTTKLVEIQLILQVVKIPAGSQRIRNLTPDLENQSNP